jgi:hypothetical protein
MAIAHLTLWVVKLQVLGNNSKTVNNIKNLRGKNEQHSKIYLP